MSPIELSPLQAQFMPDIGSLWCVNRISVHTEQTPVVMLLFMSWSLSSKEAIVQILNLQRLQPGIYYLCVSKEHSSAIRNEAQSTPELLLLNIFTDPKRILKPFLVANAITTVPTAILFNSNKRMTWHGHALSPEFMDNLTKMIRQSHIKIRNEDALLFKTLRSSSCRSISAKAKGSPKRDNNASLISPLLTSSINPIQEDSSTLQEDHCIKAHSPLARSPVLHKSRQRPPSVQRANQVMTSAAHDMMAASIREGETMYSSMIDRRVTKNDYSLGRIPTFSPSWKIPSPQKIYMQGSPTVSDHVKKYLVRSPKRERNNVLQPLRSPTSVVRAELSEITADESSSYPLVEEVVPKRSFSKSRMLHRSSSAAESVKEELGWMLIKQDSILPKPLRLPESFPTDVLRDSDGTEKLFNRSTMFLKRINV